MYLHPPVWPWTCCLKVRCGLANQWLIASLKQQDSNSAIDQQKAGLKPTVQSFSYLNSMLFRSYDVPTQSDSQHAYTLI